MNKKIGAIFFILFTFLGQTIGIGIINVKFFQATEDTEDFLEKANSNLHTAATEVVIPSVPHYYQEEGYWCGPASLEMVYDFYGPDISQLEIADVARTASSSGGTYVSDMRRAAHFSKLSTSLGDEMVGNITGYTNRPIGYGALEAHLPNVNSLVNLINDGYPIVVLQEQFTGCNYGHYRVVIGYVKDGGNIVSIITHDPWYLTPGGPNYHIGYSTFIDLWSYSANWALFICPWEITVRCSSIVAINSTFTVRVNVEYLCPSYFTPAYPASICKATIQLPSGFSLAFGESDTKELNPVNLTMGNIGTTTWIVDANVLNSTGFISVNASGLVSGYVGYSYTDLIGGNGSKLVTIVEKLPEDSDIMPIIMLSASLICSIVIGVAVILIVRRVRRKVPE